jgi:hypothetical protein
MISMVFGSVLAELLMCESSYLLAQVINQDYYSVEFPVSVDVGLIRACKEIEYVLNTALS